MTQFTDLGLAAPLLEALNREGYTTPTPIQAQAIPTIMQGRDLLGIAQTGTGKTAAFALPILHHLNQQRRPAPRKGCRVLVLCPTRELATQIADSFRTYGAFMKLTVQTVFGGVPYGKQIAALQRGIDVLVATPGRLVDHIKSGNCELGQTEFLVLDEVDQMLDLGFVNAIRFVVSGLPARRRNLFFSATMPTEIGKLAGELLNNPATVSVAPVATTAERVQQSVYLIEAGKKRDLLVELLANPDMSRTIVFTRTKRGADKVAEHLEINGIGAAAIHGNKSQSQRERSLDQFRRGRVRALVATDIAARGIDINNVTHVVNYELPEVPEAYVHRIGRTARAGAEGVAYALCANDERGLLRGIEKLTRQRLPVTDRRANPGESGAFESGMPEEGSFRPRRHAHPKRPANGNGDRSHFGDRNREGASPRGPNHAAAQAGERQPGAEAPRGPKPASRPFRPGGKPGGFKGGRPKFAAKPARARA
jgi:ATP-dependent RNA helicase RhlE